MSTAADRGFLSIGEVLSLLQDDFPDVTISKIRFLESQGLIDPERSPSGYRKFYDDDVKRLRFILHEQRANFLPLRVIRDRLGNPLEDGPPNAAPLPADVAPFASAGLSESTGPIGPAASFAASPSVPAVASPVVESVEPSAPLVALPGAVAVPGRPGGSVLSESVATGVSLSADELVRASGLSSTHLRELEGFGLIVSRLVGRTHVYDEEGLAIACLAAGFILHGIEPRHLRMYKTAVERESSLFEQAVLPMLKQRNPTARAQALDTLRALVDHGEGLRLLLARRALQAYQSPSTGAGDR